MSNPKYMRDADGFCYTYTPELEKLKHLTPYDGEVDENGVVKAPKAKPAGKSAE